MKKRFQLLTLLFIFMFYGSMSWAQKSEYVKVPDNIDFYKTVFPDVEAVFFVQKFARGAALHFKYNDHIYWIHSFNILYDIAGNKDATVKERIECLLRVKYFQHIRETEMLRNYSDIDILIREAEIEIFSGLRVDYIAFIKFCDRDLQKIYIGFDNNRFLHVFRSDINGNTRELTTFTDAPRGYKATGIKPVNAPNFGGHRIILKEEELLPVFKKVFPDMEFVNIGNSKSMYTRFNALYKGKYYDEYYFNFLFKEAGNKTVEIEDKVRCLLQFHYYDRLKRLKRHHNDSIKIEILSKKKQIFKGIPVNFHVHVNVCDFENHLVFIQHEDGIFKKVFRLGKNEKIIDIIRFNDLN